MPRTLTRQTQERFLRFGQERGNLFRALGDAPIAEKVRTYKLFEKRSVAEARTTFEKLELRRRITEDILMITCTGPWRGFSPYLRRMEKLGYSSMDCRLLVCGWSARASKDSSAGKRKTAELLASFEQRTRSRKMPPALRKQTKGVLARARQLAGLDDLRAAHEERGQPRRTKVGRLPKS
ncbi:hypothetical protein [Cystobacter ferrugineus]|uniref:Uncharacterized protein n=1 Tax=Cystobacter ferrugineus TaxID=83449 RepID=A0A1L9B952_9BACT|nr:hypothetical protein [Cystobacter ferrugineus]OJH38787.1 hypothetical protein BON30_21410 [Cystobacter ferrugineus]